MMKVLYAGSFDPITYGHMDLIKQASELFEVVVAILHNPAKKNYFFSADERLEIIKELYSNHKNIKIITSDKPAVDVAKLYGCSAFIRGIRNASDYEYEAKLGHINKDISNNSINTICLFANPQFQYISSSMVKEVFAINKNISNYVPKSVEKRMILKNNKI